VTKVSSVSEAKVGVDFDYTIRLRNNGPDAAESPTLQDVLPASLTFTGGSLTGPPGGVCTISGTPVTVNCLFPTMAVGAEFVLTLTVRATSPGDITNTATGGSATDDPDPGNNSASAHTRILALEADLEVTKVSSVSEVKVGVAFDYTIRLRNNGPDAAESPTLQDVLPASLTFTGGSLTGPPGGVCTISGTPVTVNCLFPTMAAGEEFVLILTVRATSPGDITNTATGGSATDDPDPGNNSASAGTRILALEADLEVTKVSSVSEVKVGVAFDYTIRVRNNGPDAAESPTLQDVLPASLSFVGGSLVGPPGGVCTISGTPVTVNCQFPTMAAGAEFVLTLTVRATSPGDITNTATGGSATDDPNPGNNSASAETRILALEADLEVTKVSSVSEVHVGVDFSYTIRVRNNGPDAAESPTLQDVLPASLTFTGGSLTGPPGGVCTISGTPVTVNCLFPTMAAGEEFVLILTVRATSPGDITNTATGGSVTDDPDPGNNSASAETAVISEGCSPGFWGNWPSVWGATGYAPGQPIDPVFANSGRAGLSLLEALALKGGNGPQGARDILLRAAVAALLNGAHPGVEYPMTAPEVLVRVNDALAGGNRGAMLSLATLLDGYNNLGCPLP
jgi:large repetitive protein